MGLGEGVAFPTMQAIIKGWVSPCSLFYTSAAGFLEQLLLHARVWSARSFLGQCSCYGYGHHSQHVVVVDWPDRGLERCHQIPQRPKDTATPPQLLVLLT